MIPNDYSSIAPSFQNNTPQQTSASYGQRLWQAIDNNKAAVAGAVVLVGLISTVSAQPIQQAATWSLSCCLSQGWGCRTLLVPFNNVTMQNVILPFEKLFGNRDWDHCKFYTALINHGPDFSNFTYNVVTSGAPIVAATVATTVASVAINLLM